MSSIHPTSFQPNHASLTQASFSLLDLVHSTSLLPRPLAAFLSLPPFPTSQRRSSHSLKTQYIYSPDRI